MLARICRLAGDDLERKASWIRAYKWARERTADHTVHVEDKEIPLFPLGSLDAAKSLDDADFSSFISKQVFCLWTCIDIETLQVKLPYHVTC